MNTPNATNRATNPRAVDPAIVFTSCELSSVHKLVDTLDPSPPAPLPSNARVAPLIPSPSPEGEGSAQARRAGIGREGSELSQTVCQPFREGLTTAGHEPRLAAAQQAGSGSAQPAVKRREVFVKGRRVKTIDVHAHCLIPEATKLLGQDAYKHHTGGIVLEDATTRLRDMDAQGIDMEALSINPFWYGADRDTAAEVVRINNEGLVEICARNPDRFIAFASVALQFPDLAAQQLEHAVKKLGLRGAAVGASVGDAEFADPKFHPFWRKCEELDVLIFLHPQGTPDLERRLKGNGVLDNIIGNPLDTTIALSHLIFEGTLDMFPGLKICCAHGGGYLASYMDRSDHACLTFPHRCNRTLKKRPTEYLKQLYYDALIFTPEALRHLAANVGSSQIMLGTDYPYPWEDKAVDHILNTPSLSDDERIAILGETAAKLLRIR